MEQKINDYDERIKQGLLFEKNELPKLFEGAVKNYEERLARCETEKEKQDLRLEILRGSKKNRKKIPGLAVGYKWAKVKGSTIIFTNYGTHLELCVFFSGVIDYKMELYMEGNKPQAREVLESAHKKNRGRLTTDQVHDLANKYANGKKSWKYYTNLYGEIHSDI